MKSSKKISFNQVASIIEHNYVNLEKPIEVADGVNTIFNLNFTPFENTVKVYLNGILMEEGGDNDYTINNKEITFLFIPNDGGKVRTSYFKK